MCHWIESEHDLSHFRLRIIGRYGEFPAAINAIEKEKLIVQSGQLETLKLAFYRQIASKQG